MFQWITSKLLSLLYFVNGSSFIIKLSKSLWLDEIISTKLNIFSSLLQIFAYEEIVRFHKLYVVLMKTEITGSPSICISSHYYLNWKIWIDNVFVVGMGEMNIIHKDIQRKIYGWTRNRTWDPCITIVRCSTTELSRMISTVYLTCTTSFLHLTKSSPSKTHNKHKFILSGLITKCQINGGHCTK